MQRKKIHDVNVKVPEPDQELLLWEQWIKIRNDETTKLAKKLNKTEAGLAMNLLENVREDKEWKTALEHAQIEKKPSIRGTLWEQPARLKQDCFSNPVYEIQRTAAEFGKPRIVEHVSVPEYIQKVEKGLKGEPHRVDCDQLNADFKKYKSKRENDLKEKLREIDPYRPQASELIVKGTKPKRPSKKMPSIIPTITFTSMDATEDIPDCVYAVRINNTVVVKEIPGQDQRVLQKLKNEAWHENCTSWSYYFRSPVNRAGRCKIYLQNLGTVTLKYFWKKIKKTIPYIPEEIYEQVFFFNKNEDLISPGQHKEIFFTFLSDKPGIYSEFWELSFSNINFYDTITERLTVNFSADSFENVESIQKKCMILKAKIDIKAITNIVRDVINDAIIKATSIQPQQYPYKKLFLEAEIFTMKNPVCFYHQTEVLKMKTLYCEMLPGTEWDLSISSWREAMMEKDFDNRMKYYELLRQSHLELLKPWIEGETLLEDKYRAIKMLLGQMACMFDKKYNELRDLFCPTNSEMESEEYSSLHLNSVGLDPYTREKISNIFYLYAYQYVAMTIEMCAGVLSSLDLNRWIEFDFCR